MTQDEIIRMAQEAGFVVDEKAQQHQPNCIFHTHHMVDELLERFYARAVAAEREACARLCEEKAPKWGDISAREAARDCAAAIRARSKA